jgi:hypothetical protein
MKSSLEELKKSEKTDKWDPLKLFANVEESLVVMTKGYMQLFGSSGKAK